MFRALLSKQFLRYAAVGGFSTLLDFAFLYTLVEYIHLNYLVAAVISMSIILWISFSLNKYWTFKNFQKKYFQQFASYLISHFIALGVSVSIMALLVEGFGFWYLFAKVFATVGAAITNFTLIRRFIFARKGDLSTKE